jgi:cytochrome c oxidase assembly protein subunit 11
MIKSFYKDNSTPVLCVKLCVTVVGMFVFAIFIMPPMYTLFCDITGLNGKTGGQYDATQNNYGVDTSREIKIQFIANNNEDMPWEFRPINKTVVVHPGEVTVIKYLAHNPTDKAMVGQAIPSLVPYKAVSYFHKTECFCFNSQPLQAGESAELGLSFIVDIEIPKYVKTITMSYTLFDITESQQQDQASEEKVSQIKIIPAALALVSVN